MLNTTATTVRAHSLQIGTAAGGTGKTLTPVLRPSQYRAEHGKWDVVLTITRTARGYGYEHRFGVGYVDDTGSCRRDHGGPIVPGPYAYAYGLGSAITADPRMSTAYEVDQQTKAGTEFHVEEGDIIRLGWELFMVRYLRDQWIELDHVGSAL